MRPGGTSGKTWIWPTFVPKGPTLRVFGMCSGVKRAQNGRQTGLNTRVPAPPAAKGTSGQTYPAQGHVWQSSLSADGEGTLEAFLSRFQDPWPCLSTPSGPGSRVEKVIFEMVWDVGCPARLPDCTDRLTASWPLDRFLVYAPVPLFI